LYINFRKIRGQNTRIFWLSREYAILYLIMSLNGSHVYTLIHEKVTQAIEEGVFPGCVVGIVSPEKGRVVYPFGRFIYDTHSPPVERETIYDVASITKSIPTASLALQFVDEGVLAVDDKLLRFIPEISHSNRENMKIHHLLTHTLHFSFSLSSLKERAPREIIETIYRRELLSPPGVRFCYSNATSILLGIVVERVGLSSLDALAQARFFSPLSMHRTSFSPMDIAPKQEIVPTEFDPWRNRLVQGEVHDESAYTLGAIMKPGSAGLFSTAQDLLTFCEMLLHGGTLRGKRYFSKQMVNRISTNQRAENAEKTGLGWELDQPRFMGSECSSRAFGKTGFTGCSIVCDPEKNVGIVLLSNWTYPNRKQRREQIDRVRASIADTVYRYGI
jgi:CubicO group peptidase (beta-lactamase class C family)